MAIPRILITRAPHQASALAEQVRRLGIEPILIPTIELAEPTTFDPLDDALGQLDTFHWLLFTSANAVEVFHRRRSNSRIKNAALSCRIAAIGQATARALESTGLRVDLLSEQAVAESFAEALLPYGRQADGSPTRFLLIRAEAARDVIPDALRAAGADVTIAPAYGTVIPSGSVSAIQELFRSPANYPDAITFTSSSTATNLLALLEAANLILPPEVLRISIGRITSQTLREMHLPPHAEAAEPNVPSLVDVIVKSLNLESTT